MIYRERHVAHRPHNDLLFTVHLISDNAALEFSHAEYRRLRLVDDYRSRDDASADAVIGDGEGAVLNVLWLQRAATCPLSQILKAMSNAEKIELLRLHDHRDNQASVRKCRRDADVDVVEDLETVVMPATVRFGHRLERLYRSCDEVRRIGEFCSSRLEIGFVGVPMCHNGGQVRVEDARNVRRDGHALHHVLCDASPHLRVRNAVAWNRRSCTWRGAWSGSCLGGVKFSVCCARSNHIHHILMRNASAT